jgi:hypothetical protein
MGATNRRCPLPLRQALEPLAPTLAELDLSHNRVAALHGVGGGCLLAFHSLTTWDLGFNQLASLEDLVAIARWAGMGVNEVHSRWCTALVSLPRLERDALMGSPAQS